jgi:hypothetical protein
MKAEQIYISDFDFLSLERLEIDQWIGQHATAVISGYISDEYVHEYQGRVMENRLVTITAVGEDGEKKAVMGGIIAGFSFEKMTHDVKMCLVLKSGTYLMDRTPHFRSFQNLNETYLDVMNRISAFYGSHGVIAESCVQQETVDFLLQYKETDWTFVRRLASRFGLEVTPAITREGVFYYVGNASSDTYRLTDTVYCMGKNMDAFMIQGANGAGGKDEQDYLEYRLSTRELYDLWDRLVLGNGSGYVWHIHREYKHGELYNTYILRAGHGMKTERIFNGYQSGCSFKATVRSVMQDMVQISIADDENRDQKVTKWFPFSTGYSSPNGAGWYCMPEIGDCVRLQIPGHAEEDGYVISAVHLETGNDRKNPDHKSFKTRYGKELLFTPDSLELTNHQGMSIRIKDGEGIQIVSSRDISISSGGTMTLSSEDASLVIAGTESVDIRQGGAGLHIDKDIIFSGGKFRIQ